MTIGHYYIGVQIICMLGNICIFLLACLFFSKLMFSEKNPSGSINLDSDQAEHFVWPDQVQECLQHFSKSPSGQVKNKLNYVL